MVIFNAIEINIHLRSLILSNEHTINKYLPIKTPVNKIRISYPYTEMKINYFISIWILYFLYTQNISFNLDIWHNFQVLKLHFGAISIKILVKPKGGKYLKKLNIVKAFSFTKQYIFSLILNKNPLKGKNNWDETLIKKFKINFQMGQEKKKWA